MNKVETAQALRSAIDKIANWLRANLGTEALTASRSAIIIVPLLGMALQSALSLPMASRESWASVLIYWTVRASLFALFLVLARFLIPTTYRFETKHPKKPIVIHHDPLLGLRGLAFLMVLLGHWFMVVFPPENVTDPKSLAEGLWLLTASPWGGVWVFFTLSGYLMGKGFVYQRYQPNRDGIVCYFRNRALRILPLYFASIVVVGIFFRPDFFLITEPHQFFNFVSVITFNDKGDHIHSPIGALWSISTEVQFYFFVPFLFVILQGIFALRAVVPMTIGTLAIVSIGVKTILIINFNAVPDFWNDYLYSPLLGNTDLFLIGFATAFAVKKSAVVFRHGLCIGIFLSAFLYLGLAYWSVKGMLDNTRSLWATEAFVGMAPALTSLCTALIIFIFERADRSITISISSIGWKISTNLGLWTYALYVWHEPVLLAVRKIAPGTMSPLDSVCYFALTAPLLFAFAFFFYKQVELPFDRLKGGQTLRQEV
jgi:peptidoglycan/LPS O-acetylase OafA/YrhL